MSVNTRQVSVLSVIIVYIAVHGSSFVLETLHQSDSSIPDLAESPLLIGSFNIQVFGKTKNSIPEVVDVLVKILSRYDIVQILEIRDADQIAFESLRTSVNSYVKTHGGSYFYQKVQSERLGRTSSKEQYGFLYRTDKVSVIDTYQLPDTADVFEREPFGVRFNSTTTVTEDFGLVATHIRPSSAKQEIGNLTNAYYSFKRHWNLENIIIAGDFNSDCTYLSAGELEAIHFRTDSRFYWAIPDNVDTTVQNDRCSYDKFVITGDSLIASVVPNSARAYRFDEIMSINNSEALRVSDHYPIEISLAGKPFPLNQGGIQSSVGFTVQDTQTVSNVNNIRAIYRAPTCADANFRIQVKRDDTRMDFVTASLTSLDTTALMVDLLNFSKTCSGTVSMKLLATVDAYLKSNYLSGQKPNVYGLMFSSGKSMYETVITCSLQSPYVCKIHVSLQMS